MNISALNEYVRVFIKDIIYSKGYIYLSDSLLFIQEKLSSLLRQLNHSYENMELANILKLDIILPNELKILINYQLFLNNNKFDKRYKKKVFWLIDEILISDGEISKERGRHYYIKSKINLVFIDSVNEIISKNKWLFPQKENLFYRGHSNLNWELLPSIYRRNSWIDNEHNMFRDILIRNPNEFRQTKSAFEKLTITQHYGLPTRLLDITKNPLVAMYFACADRTQLKMPGEVFIFSPDPKIVKFYDSDTVSVISNLSKVERNFVYISNKTNFNNSDEGKKLLHLIKEEKPYFEPEIIPSDLQKTLIVKPVNNNERIKRQLGYFFIFGIKGDILNSAEIDFSYKSNSKRIKVIIEPDRTKNRILNELKAIGISEDTLFPEIENGTKYIWR